MEIFALVLLAPATWMALAVLLVFAVGAAWDRRWPRVAALVLSGAAVVALSQLLNPLLGAVTSAEEGGTDSSPPWPCRIDGKPAEQVVDYRVDLFPVVGFSCVLSDGSSYDTGRVPARATPLAAGLAVAAGGALYASRRRPGA
ncbi:hypothetical protein Kpho02_11690 [Kitasatospora phosalacinea]|uniref:Uncharacterized protein n=1 Tax=Kitasatospora phosalacinea TaxID=2065 RepID=A0A9W6V1F7_9ACTN|nr:hypothetical protein [Kitasatospora phosalacinea]GLW68870.1 hypothetical protein Kpho02_11690 [Kitasatospora phosalacinea]